MSLHKTIVGNHFHQKLSVHPGLKFRPEIGTSSMILVSLNSPTTDSTRSTQVKLYQALILILRPKPGPRTKGKKREKKPLFSQLQSPDGISRIWRANTRAVNQPLRKEHSPFPSQWNPLNHGYTSDIEHEKSLAH